MRVTTPCPYGDTRHERNQRHEHPYKIREFGARRCTCGSVHWKVAIGGPLPLAVQCDRCERRNYSATAYETGRDDERREPPRDPAPRKDPPF